MASKSFFRPWNVLAVIVSALALLALACGGAEPTATRQPTATTAATQPPTPTQDAWEALVEAARQEGVVRVYGPPGSDLRQSVVDAWNAAYPGIRMEFTGVTGQQVFQKVRSEVEGGVATADVIFNGTSEATRSLKPDGILEGPIDTWLIHPDAKDTSKWLGGQIPWVDQEHYMIGMASQVGAAMIYNKDKVQPGEVRNIEDLVDPKWQGQIVTLNPLTGGAGSSFFEDTYQDYDDKEKVQELFTKLVRDQKLVVTDEPRQAADWVSQGRYAIGLGVSPRTVGEYLDQGVELGVISDSDWDQVRSVSWGYAGLWVPRNPEHPNAAKLFVNWILTKEGQEAAVANGLQYATARLDVSKDKVNEFQVPDPNKDHTCSSCEEFMTGPIPDIVRDMLIEAGLE